MAAGDPLLSITRRIDFFPAFGRGDPVERRIGFDLVQLVHFYPVDGDRVVHLIFGVLVVLP